MSEPMSNHEIEDVLSSIRRLVSEDLRPAAKPADSGGAAEAAVRSAAPAGKLLLTPALRVVNEAPTAPEQEGAADNGPAEPAPAATVDEPAAPEVQDVVSRLGAAVGDADEDWESPLGDPPAWSDIGQSDPPPRFRAVAEEGAEGAPAFLDAASDIYSTIEEAELSSGDDLAVDEASAAPKARWPETRRTVTPPADDWGTEGWADAAEAEVRAKLERELEDDTQSMFAAQDVTFDEEVLRDLVRDIIREELAGTLGERITRNVRKLVRAEIARALAVREFE